MAENTVTIVGTITQDLELRHTPNGAAVVDINIAQNKRVRQPDGTWEQGDAMYFVCTVWQDMAEHANATLQKGMRVIVTGRLDYQTWENTEGQVRSTIKVVADEIGPSLRWATANVERISGGSMGDSPQGGASPDSTPPSNDKEGTVSKPRLKRYRDSTSPPTNRQTYNAMLKFFTFLKNRGEPLVGWSVCAVLAYFQILFP